MRLEACSCEWRPPKRRLSIYSGCNPSRRRRPGAALLLFGPGSACPFAWRWTKVAELDRDLLCVRCAPFAPVLFLARFSSIVGPGPSMQRAVRGAIRELSLGIVCVSACLGPMHCTRKGAGDGEEAAARVCTVGLGRVAPARAAHHEDAGSGDPCTMSEAVCVSACGRIPADPRPQASRVRPRGHQLNAPRHAPGGSG